MKDQSYNTKVCFSLNSLISCGCQCPCGSRNDGKIACVHTFVPMLQMSHLLLDGWTEHILCELAARWHTVPPQNDNDEEVRGALSRLMCLVDATKYCKLVNTEKTVSKLLYTFRVGTEQPKAMPQPPPHNTVYRPIRQENFGASASKQAIDFVNAKLGNVQLKADAVVREEEEIGQFVPAYTQICQAAKEADRIIGDERTRVLINRNERRGNILGNKLLKLRSLNEEDAVTFELDDCRDKLFDAFKKCLTRQTIKTERAEDKKKSSSTADPADDPDFTIHKPNDMIDDGEEDDDDDKSVTPNDEVAAKKRRAHGAHWSCCFPGCRSNSTNCRHYHRIPVEPKQPESNSCRVKWLKYWAKYYHYVETKRRIQIPEDTKSRGETETDDRVLRICHLHTAEEKKDLKTVMLPQVDNGVNLKCSINLKYMVPSATGVSNLSLGPDSRGNAVERGHLALLERLDMQSKGEGLKSPGKGLTSKEEELMAENAMLKAEIASEKLERYRTSEMKSPTNLRLVKKRMLEASGLHVHLGTSPRRSKLFRIVDVTEAGRTGTESTKKQYTPREKDPRVTPFSLCPFEVAARTGFVDAGLLLSFTLLVCNGDIDMMTKRVSELTWYEEWFQYYEYIWGRSITNRATSMAAFGIKNQKIVRRVIMSKLRMVLHARKMWPKYANMKEDEMLRDAKWNDKYKGKRMVFWDTTGIKLNTPSDALLQRLTYSAYYAGNVARGGIFVQLCGWLGTHELYPGAMPDSRYLNETGIFQEQAAFMAEDGGDAFINEVDRGFRSCLAAWKSGQFILQPNFMNSDGKFTTGEVLRSASIAADRSGNERAVRVTKMSAYVKRGTTAHNDIERLADVWLAWSFQANFMFKSVM